MKGIVEDIKNDFKDTKILVGGAPVTMDYCKSIGADFFSPNPQGAVEYLKQFAA
jgi:5-methyltetrahydrofolate--homocysteine methyltransferase